MMPKVDIVIINHNYGDFLCSAIDSALGQSVRPSSVVVVDDGSTDRSRSIIAGYGDRLISVLQERQGHVAAVNAGYAVGSADLCIFLDADDVLLPTCVEEVSAAWRPEQSKVQYQLNTINKDGVDQELTFPHFPADLTSAAVRDQSIKTSWYPWTVSSGNAFSRSFLKQLMPIDTKTIYRSPDGYLSKLAPLFGDVESLRKVLGSYRVHGSNAWASAGDAWSADTAIRWLKFDRVLENAFIEAAERQNITLPLPLRPSFQQLEYRALALRFAPDRTPFERETKIGLLKTCIRACFTTERLGLMSRVLWLGWFVTLCLAPRPIVMMVVGRARGQSGRSGVARKVLAFARGQRAKT